VLHWTQLQMLRSNFSSSQTFKSSPLLQWYHHSFEWSGCSLTWIIYSNRPFCNGKENIQRSIVSNISENEWSSFSSVGYSSRLTVGSRPSKKVWSDSRSTVDYCRTQRQNASRIILCFLFLQTPFSIVRIRILGLFLVRIVYGPRNINTRVRASHFWLR
jgi:hypothetical protein